MQTKVVICNWCIQALSFATVAYKSHHSFDAILQYFASFSCYCFELSTQVNFLIPNILHQHNFVDSTHNIFSLCSIQAIFWPTLMIICSCGVEKSNFGSYVKTQIWSFHYVIDFYFHFLLWFKFLHTWLINVSFLTKLLLLSPPFPDIIFIQQATATPPFPTYWLKYWDSWHIRTIIKNWEVFYLVLQSILPLS